MTYGIFLRYDGTGHQLDLVKEHQRQNDRADGRGWLAKIALAIGIPLARDFFEPQKVIVISSSFEKPSTRLPKIVTHRTTPSRSGGGAAARSGDAGPTEARPRSR